MKPIIAALLVLAGCDGEPPPPANDATAAASDAGAPASDLPRAPSPTSPPAVDAPEKPPLTTIPAAFTGRWGITAEDCTSTRGDAKGLMTIEADRILFYESVARPAALTLAGDRRIDGNFSAVGEGQTWTMLMRLELGRGGNTLTRFLDEGDSAASPGGNRFVYRRCA